MNLQAKTLRNGIGKSPWFRRLVLWGIGVAFVLGGCVMACLAGNSFRLPNRSGPPIVELPVDHWNLGKVDAGESFTAHFQVSNQGGRRLILNELARSCGCLAAGKSELVVPAGSTRTLPVTLDTQRVRGPMQMTLEFSTNDPQRTKLQLTVLADVVATAESEKETSLAPIAISSGH